MKCHSILICAVCLALLLSSCWGPSELEQQVMDAVTAQVEPFTSGDIVQINGVLFPYAAESNDSGALTGEGMLAPLMRQSTVIVKSAEEAEVILEVTAPDMRAVFTDHAQTLLTATSAEEMAQMLLDYAEQARTVTTEVSLPYTLEGSEVIVDYSDPNLIDALTGGLLGAYHGLYTQYYEGLGGMIE